MENAYIGMEEEFIIDIFGVSNPLCGGTFKHHKK